MSMGITPPISTSPPTENDIKFSSNLEDVLRQHGMFESDVEARKREIVLGKLNMLVKKFVKRVCLKQGLSESFASEAGGKIFTFGSYRLGVHSSGADIDTLCVVPQNVERVEFFTLFFETLKNHSEVSELTAVPDAYVPVIKMNFDGIPIDLLFAQLNLQIIPDDLDLLDNSLLRSIDEKCILSINGSRVADQIVRLVPNLSNFRLALRCIKLWAKKRAIYSNVMGYLGGVAWALMVGRICQLYPNASASRIVSSFFTIFYQWRWPAPVLLKQTEDGPLPVWNPRTNSMDRNHRMPVITPAYPAMCATHNVSASTLSVMTAEFYRGMKICLNIEHERGTWDDLFSKSDFFFRYKTYLRIVVGSTSEEFQRMWVGMVESKLRMLVMKLESVLGVESAPPFPYGFECSVSGNNLENALQNRTEPGTSILDEISESRKYYCTSYYIGLCIKMKLSENSIAPKKLSIERPVSEFKRMVQQWEKYLPTEMDILIQVTKRSDLPDEVYDGLPRPSKLKKTKTGKGNSKRKISLLQEIDGDEDSSQAKNDDAISQRNSESRELLENGEAEEYDGETRHTLLTEAGSVNELTSTNVESRLESNWERPNISIRLNKA